MPRQRETTERRALDVSFRAFVISWRSVPSVTQRKRPGRTGRPASPASVTTACHENSKPRKRALDVSFRAFVISWRSVTVRNHRKRPARTGRPASPASGATACYEKTRNHEKKTAGCFVSCFRDFVAFRTVRNPPQGRDGPNDLRHPPRVTTACHENAKPRKKERWMFVS